MVRLRLGKEARVVGVSGGAGKGPLYQEAPEVPPHVQLVDMTIPNLPPSCAEPKGAIYSATGPLHMLPSVPVMIFSHPKLFVRLRLVEIRAVALRTVAIKGVHSVRYLCMGADGRMQGLPQYSEEDCAFEEEIRPDGYNVYQSKKHRLPVSLSTAKQRQLYKGRGFLPLSHFLPMLPLTPVEPGDLTDHLESDMFSSPLETDSMDPFGIATKLGLVKSPSFQK
ncbi:PREDICTED: fibroblast growth factor 19 [Galeopterus variegatus]|uniref:Fibroblast growth factor n=1 Tax=Galeopterus variegatus TaxID=482537 RepID=A0ABM0S213_GALVR|nr:PREDICTED: fibroblast growth factor 19 [Galeopterus variegatus]